MHMAENPPDGRYIIYAHNQDSAGAFCYGNLQYKFLFFTLIFFLSLAHKSSLLFTLKRPVRVPLTCKMFLDFVLN